MRVNEIFYSIQGEGSSAGTPCVFVRLSGCNYKCSWCDTQYHTEYLDMTVSQVMSEISKYDCNLVEFTGGEPLLQMAELTNLIERLRNKKKTVIVETNNSILPSTKLAALVDTFVVDFKCPSSEVNWGDVEEWNSTKWSDSDEIKFVVADEADVEFATDIICEKLEFFYGKIYFSPVWGQMDFNDLAEVVKKFGMDKRVKMQLQMHKVIWDINKRGV